LKLANIKKIKSEISKKLNFKVKLEKNKSEISEKIKINKSEIIKK
jgi:hypothetical protein